MTARLMIGLDVGSTTVNRFETKERARLTIAKDLFLQAACATTSSDGSVRGCR
jgi:hypothetical protein